MHAEGAAAVRFGAQVAAWESGVGQTARPKHPLPPLLSSRIRPREREHSPRGREHRRGAAIPIGPIFESFCFYG